MLLTMNICYIEIVTYNTGKKKGESSVAAVKRKRIYLNYVIYFSATFYMRRNSPIT